MLAAIASLLLHALIVGVFSRSRSDGQAALVPASSTANEPLEIEIVELEEVPSAIDQRASARSSVEPDDSSQSARSSSRNDQRYAEPVSSDSDPASKPSSETPSRLRMRGRGDPIPRSTPNRRDSEPGGRYPVDPLAGPPQGVLPLAPLERPTLPKSELISRGGRLQSNKLTFVAEAREDGTVVIEDKPNVWVRVAIPDRKLVGAIMKSWQADPYKHATGQSEIELPSDAIVGGGFDATDAVMRKIGDDPYVIEKLSFLNRTRGERAQIKMTHEAALLAGAARTARQNVAAIERRSDLSDTQKRRIYFELWDECEEGGREAVRDATGAARATIVGFIRKRYPAGSRRAYREQELSALNKGRSSTARFAPYANAW